MKAKQVNQPIKGFEPVSIEITFETLEEVRDFFCTMNSTPIQNSVCYDMSIIREAIGTEHHNIKRQKEFANTLHENIVNN